MLDLTIPKIELYDEQKEEFFEVGPYHIVMEHSLVSISKWESKWHKPFIGSKGLTTEEILDYLKCMTITQNVKPEVYTYLTDENMKQINDYIDDPATGTIFYEFNSNSKKHKLISSEEIYSQMFMLGIPMECQKWHINKLLAQIRVCDIDRSDKKMTKAETIQAYRRLNAERRKKLNSKG